MGQAFSKCKKSSSKKDDLNSCTELELTNTESPSKNDEYSKEGTVLAFLNIK